MTKKRADIIPTKVLQLSPHDCWLEVHAITSKQEALKADEAFLAVCAVYDKADEIRKELKKDALEACQRRDAQWRKDRAPIEMVRDHLARLLSDYEAVERSKAIKAAATTAKKLKDKERAVALIRRADQEPSLTDLPHGVWLDDHQFDVVDWRSVPEELLQLNMTEVKKACKAGKPLPGIQVMRRFKRSARLS